MLEIIVEPRRAFNLRQAVVVAVESGDYDSLYDDIRDCFTDEQVEQIEEILESGDFAEAIDDIVSEWNADDVEDLFEAIVVFFADSNVEIQFILDEDFEEETEVDLDDFDDDDSAVEGDEYEGEEEEE